MRIKRRTGCAWVVLTAAAFILAGCGGGDEQSQAPALPEAAVTEDTSVVLHLDADAMSPEKLRASAMTLIQAMPESSAKQREMALAELDEQLAEYRPLYNNLVEQGGEGVTVAGSPRPEDESKGAILIRTAENADLSALRSAVASFAESQDRPLPEAFQIERLNEKWGYLTGDDKFVSPQAGSTEATASFSAALDHVPGGIKLAFRMTETIQAELRQSADSVPPPLMALTGPLQQLNFAVLGITTGGEPKATAQMRFAEKSAAGAFQEAWSGLIAMGKGITQAQIARLPDAPDAESVAALFDALAMKQDASTLSLTLDTRFVENLAKVAPTFAALMMGMPTAPGGGMTGDGRSGDEGMN